jgi:hypothetical protein
MLPTYPRENTFVRARHWENTWIPKTHPTNEEVSQRYSYVSGEYRTAAEAEKAVPDDWELIRFSQSAKPREEADER